MLLSFDSSTPEVCVALIADGRVLARHSDIVPKQQSAALFPMIEMLLADAKVTKHDIKTIGVGIGPGNFTGIRLAVAAARGLSDALSIPAIGISRLDAMLLDQPEACLAVIDAKGGKLYAQYPNQAPNLLDHDVLSTVSGAVVVDLPKTVLAQSDLQPISAKHPLAVAIGLIAETKTNGPITSPSPLYIKAASADLPSDPPIRILP